MHADSNTRKLPKRAWPPAVGQKGVRGRRLARLTTLAASAATVAALAACGSSGGSSSSAATGDSSSSAAAAPNGIVGQTLTVQYTEPTSINPALGGIQEVAVAYQELAYDSLIYQDQTGAFVPDLAVKWGYVAGSGNKSFQLTLRSGVKFSDGSPLTAQAVANSLNYFKKASGPQSYLLAALTDIKVTGPLALTLNFATATPDLPFLLSQSENVGAIIGPKGLANPTSLNTTTDGAGAYTLTAGGSGAGGAFELAGGQQTLAYSVEWAQSTGQESGRTLSGGQTATNLQAAATQSDCGSGTGSASLVVAMNSTQLAAAQPGTAYTGALTLTVSPQ